MVHFLISLSIYFHIRVLTFFISRFYVFLFIQKFESKKISNLKLEKKTLKQKMKKVKKKEKDMNMKI